MAWARFPFRTRIVVIFGVLPSRLLIRTFRSLGHNLTDTVVMRRNATLVTRGPDRWVRHPSYLATGITFIASARVTANGYVGETGVAALPVIIARTTLEEGQLIDRFDTDCGEHTPVSTSYPSQAQLNTLSVRTRKRDVIGHVTPFGPTC